jgi:predicted O-methyltransferase YrrM
MDLNCKNGASLRVWSEIFPNANIYGADIDKTILFNEDRIKTYYCDERDLNSIKSMWENIDVKFDIIIDDGIHEFNDNIRFFEYSIHKLNHNGYYIIEDIHHYDLLNFRNNIRELESIYPDLQFQLLCVPNKNYNDNTILIIYYKYHYTLDLTSNLHNSLNLLYNTIPNNPMICVEIGSFEGKGSLLIADKLCKNKDSKLYCIDPLDNKYVKDNANLSFWDNVCNGQKDKFYYNTKNYPNIILLEGTSDDMISKIEDNTIDFVYIDGDHSPEQVYKDAINMLPKMKSNSIILFDDYEFNINNIKTSVGIDKFLKETKDKYELLFKKYQLAIRLK